MPPLRTAERPPLVGPGPYLPSRRVTSYRRSRLPRFQEASFLPWALAVLVVAATAVLLVRELGQAGALVTVTVDGHAEQVRTTRAEVGQVLTDLGLVLRPEDHVSLPLDAPLAPGAKIAVERARRGVVSADGAVFDVYSHAVTARQLVAAVGLSLGINDELWLGNERVDPETALPRPPAVSSGLRFARSRSWVGLQPPAVHLSIRRAVPITVDDGSVPYTIFTTAPTIGEALLRELVTVYLGDIVLPGLGSPVSAGQRVSIVRSRPVLITADGRTLRSRTRGKSVGDALSELGINVTGSDRVTPPMSEQLVDNTAIKIVRVLETMQVERETIPFAAIVAPDDNLEIDLQHLDHPGAEGEFRRRYRVVFEDGVQISRSLTDAWVAAQPITRTLSYGRKVVLRTLQTPDGPVTYWRKINMYATAYSASTAGVSPSSPWYGITATGLRMTRGLVAVDPSIIPLRTKVFVAGYGVGLAADTGGAIRSKRIDLGYDDNNLVGWSRWVDVYLLGNPPPASQIRWVLPNWPQQ